jgi:hypothetical protein
MIEFAARGRVDPWTPLYAAGLLAVAELSYWSISRRLAIVEEPDVVLSRAGTLVGLCAAGAVVSGLVVVAAGSGARGGLALEAVGVAAAIALVGLLAALARK